ncbi:protein-glutamate O-methyltransferase CheR [Pedobacter sp. LMG 31464]|uniref:Protein-glutamate O-methyltransferase CheR n=1 Tax=Pedobacter planticolens TaxID=2679964 RepID=A0A923E3Q7_9SPHI|nr:protein-glutamate O-methyltransferase CheR [Pedobacter planticolens]MBB2146949.1 protein-glutamate O-methyltransferase CheR [Pedobacter planticolens]
MSKHLEHVSTLTNEELNDLILLIRKIHDFDFSGYSQASFKRQVIKLMILEKLSYFDLRALLINDSNYIEHFLIKVTVNVTEMFRDPQFYNSIKQHIIPYLDSYQRIKVWSAGCSSGEEVYSLAILFFDEKLYQRSFFYGTDVNSEVLNTAKNAIYSLKQMRQYSENYIETGAITSLEKYYTAKYDAAVIRHSLKKNTLFSVHNLITDGVFNEFQVISCRNVLIYFTKELQSKVIELFYDSLTNFGFLCLGSKESIRDLTLLAKFKIIDKKNNIYQKIPLTSSH